MDEELDNLREKSARTSTIYDDLEMEGAGSKDAGNALAGLTPQQRLVLAFLLFLNVIACACGVFYFISQ